MLRNYYIERIINPKDTRLEYIYESLLQPNFSPGEIEPIEKLRTLIENTANKTTRNPLVLMVVYNNHDNNPASLINGNILDFGEVGCGAIGYTVTKEEHRRKGLASSLVEAFEQQISKNNRHPKVSILEGRRGSGGFWDKIGYGKVQDGKVNVVYHQPPIEFDFRTGDPVFGEIRETLKAKPLNGERGREDFRKWLMRSVEGMSREWYLPERTRFETERAYRSAVRNSERTVQTNLDSIRDAVKLRLSNHRMY
jgi:GNAT superfamily N-acetyltransferase